MIGCVLIETLVWTVIVEVKLVRAKHDMGVALVVNQHPVGALGSDASNEPFCIAGCARRLRWRLDDLNVLSHGYIPVQKPPKRAEPGTATSPWTPTP
jgi:hypothetical protein